jgi:hypothetical protein
MRDVRQAGAGVGKLAGCQRPTKSPNNNANDFWLAIMLSRTEQSLVYGVQQGDSHIELEPVDTPP